MLKCGTCTCRLITSNGAWNGSYGQKFILQQKTGYTKVIDNIGKCCLVTGHKRPLLTKRY